MPLKTFLNLPAGRRKKIIGICMREFAGNTYESVSLSKIIKELGLAKGSFYRYFETKKDLYIYLVDISRKLNWEQTYKFYKNPDYDFFEAITHSFIGALQTEKEYPAYLRFSFRVSMERRYDILGDLVDSYKKEKETLLEEIIRYHQAQGNLRRDVELPKMVQAINYMILGIREFFFRKYYPAAALPDDADLIHIPEDRLREELEEYLLLLRTGMQLVH